MAAILALVFLFFSCQAWELKLSPSPETGSIGQRPTGTPIAIMCSATGMSKDQRPTITWTKLQSDNGKDITTTGHVEIKNLDPFTASLVIQNGSLEDNGVYICNARFDEEAKKASIDINFFEELHFIDDINEIDIQQEGVAVNLSCLVVPGEDTITVGNQANDRDQSLITMWEKGIIGLSEASERNYTFYEHGQVLQINKYSHAHDEGTYHCKVFDRRTGSMISKQIKIGKYFNNCISQCATGRLTKKRQHFCLHLCTNLCHSLYVKPADRSTSIRQP
uniref:Ig-like domain-containing protein n=1 Tax=Panagrolaimus sp. JU765 TaxID=591449 RepID=A0AC34Q297_9BILA